MGKRKHDVFVSYRSRDVELAWVLAAYLKKAGLRVWLDTWQIVGGDDFAAKIEAALESCRAVVVLVGRSGFGPWQRREIAVAAEESGVRLIPVLLPKAKPGTRLALGGLSYVDLRKGIDKDGIRALVAAVKAKPNQAAPSGKPAAPLRRKSAKAKVGGGITVRGNNNQVATNGSIVAGNITGSIVTVGKGNVVQTGKSRGW